MGRRIPTHYKLTALSLYEAKRISLEDFGRLSFAETAEAMSEIAERLRKSGQISRSQRDELVSSWEREKHAEARANMKAKLREVDRYVGGGKGSPVAQGGLPSLGKRRP